MNFLIKITLIFLIILSKGNVFADRTSVILTEGESTHAKQTLIQTPRKLLFMETPWAGSSI